MKKIDQLIQETQKQISDLQSQGQALEQEIQQKQQQLQMIGQQYNASITRLNTLQEVAGTGEAVFRDEEAEPNASQEQLSQTNDQAVSQ